MTRRYEEIKQWISIYVYNPEDSKTLTDQLYNLSVKHSKQTFAIGLVSGMVAMGILILWVS